MEFAYLIATVALSAALWAFGHVVLRQDQTKATLGWVAAIWFIPLLGAGLYALFGINRIERRLKAQRRSVALSTGDPCSEHVPSELGPRLNSLACLVGKVSGRVLTSGNQIRELCNGEEAYPEMLAAIDSAKTSICLCTYIFDNDAAGRRFVHALGEARRRGVEVRVLIDALGVLYSWPFLVTRKLLRADVSVGLFLPTLWSWRVPYINLRNHRKTLVVDGSIGFTGGMNIREGHLVTECKSAPIQDLQFRCVGPVVQQMQRVFAEDWLFTTGEQLQGESWFPELRNPGTVIARGISDGPDEDLNILPWTLRGAIDAASERIQILTPYFLPKESLMSALGAAALRGVAVDIVVPERGNLAIVRWASHRFYREALQYDCRVWLTPAPFDHSKLMVVDGRWCTFGSANWDPRSLRLNFEFNIECYDLELASRLGSLIDTRRAKARRLSSREIDAQSLPVKLRNGFVSLFAANL